MRMTSHEIRPKQLRALLFLLVLVPLIPAALMLRFMAETLKGERFAALSRMEQFHSSAMVTALRGEDFKHRGDHQRLANEIVERLTTLIPDGGSFRVLDERGQWLAGVRAPWGEPLAQGVTSALPGGLVQTFLTDKSVLDRALADQRNFLFWTGALSTMGILIIAVTAGFALHRQLALRELKSTSVATLAHELRTPLASMRMLVDTLREGRYRGDQQLKEYLELIAAENQRLGTLSESFLTFSRLDHQMDLLLEEAPIADVIDQGIAPLRPRLSASDCVFTVEIPSPSPVIRAHRSFLAEALTNLLENALKYTGADKKLELRVTTEGSSVVIAISDNGVGIPEKELRSIFQPFYQIDQKLSRSREGCGLGLAIVHRIIKAHGGTISVSNRRQGGSTFELKLPRA